MDDRYGRTSGAIGGTIRRRLLVNALVDPGEAARRLPAGLRPHVTGGGTVVGCCLLQIDSVRPAALPAMLGTRLLAAAHRISVEWDTGPGTTVVGVYVPTRHTDSRAARVVGGRWFPGLHRRAAIDVADDGRWLRWSVEPGARASAYRIQVSALVPSTVASTPCEPVGAACLGAAIGVSPLHDGVLEAARMEPQHWRAHLVEIEHLASGFLAGFTTARPAPSYLVRDVPVTWTRAQPPEPAPAGALG
jgi:hypothetical protein